jgi:hypothetical protein
MEKTMNDHNAVNNHARAEVTNKVSAIDAYSVKWINEPGKGYVTVGTNNVKGAWWDQLHSDARLTKIYQDKIKALYASKGIEIID